MNLYEINPFIRFSKPKTLFSDTKTVSSYDHRIFYIINNDIKITINDITYDVPSGSVMLWNSGVKYKFQIDKKTEIISINFDYTQKNRIIASEMKPIIYKSFNKNKVLENVIFEDAEALNMPLIIKNMTQIKEKLDKLCDLFSKKEIFYQEKCSLLLKEIIIDLFEKKIFHSTDTSDRISKAIEYIQANYSKKITNTNIAKTVNYHPYHLNRIMLKYTGFSTHQYLLNYRIEKAKELILRKNYSISDIADKCGFNSSFHLSSTFKRKVGISPREYKKQRQNLL